MPARYGERPERVQGLQGSRPGGFGKNGCKDCKESGPVCYCNRAKMSTDVVFNLTRLGYAVCITILPLPVDGPATHIQVNLRLRRAPDIIATPIPAAAFEMRQVIDVAQAEWDPTAVATCTAELLICAWQAITAAQAARN